MLRDAAAHHELNPAVKHVEAKAPRAVEVLRPCHHRVEVVLGLSVPGLVHDAGGDDLLSGSGKHFHGGAHSCEVGIAPQRCVVVAGLSERVLPQVEVEGPVLRCGQGTVDDLDVERQLGHGALAGLDGELSTIGAGSSISRHLAAYPYGAGAHGIHGDCFYMRVNHVGYHGRVIDGVVGAMAAACATSVGSAPCIGLHIAHEGGLHSINR